MEKMEQNEFASPLCIENSGSLMRSQRALGEGEFGTVDEVFLPTKPEPLICVRKRVAKPKQWNTHRRVMEAFIREVSVMAKLITSIVSVLLAATQIAGFWVSSYNLCRTCIWLSYLKRRRHQKNGTVYSSKV
ncbi:hypothetical protein BU25DRAFT_62755 [Macroventuria anomochaeta]|uniref:Uncharacterized protein n=1 Tax=Macroventuria anomochaeta TaxID=301207 RepID=A0ACB6S0B5_9PLEO|nr:uncharacterized protein BU25DRAFT_62755 [Macroventuria anomochaeta]KAF2627388.1 hypothetical protein BU25DRAFT_62755 [Macroventuria anomochaeta]